MNTQYRKDLKAVMQVGKNYTDDKIQEVLDLVSDYNVNSQEVEQLSQSATAPNKDIRTTSLMVVGGNSVKYAPSTPSDDSVARLKVIPENTYKSQIDYIGGKSVKYNQLVQNGNFESASGWSSYSSENTSLSIANNTATITVTDISSAQDYSYGLRNGGGSIPTSIIGHKYFIVVIGNPSSFQNFRLDSYGGGQQLTKVGNLYGTIWNCASERNYILIKPNDISNIQVGNNFSVSGVESIDLTDIFGSGNEPSTVEAAIPLLKANGYKLDGTDEYSIGDFKHAVVSVVKYSPINLFDLISYVNEPLTVSRCSVTASNNKLVLSATGEDAYVGYVATTNGTAYSPGFGIKIPIRAGVSYYYLSLSNTSFQKNYITFFGSDDKSIGFSSMSSNATYFSIPSGTKYICIRLGISNSVSGTTYETTIMLNEGNTALPYIPYAQPKLLPMPSEVLADVRYGLGYDDNNYNHLDIDGHLRGSWGIVDLGSLTWEYVTTSGTNPFFSTQLVGISLEQTRKVLCAIYDIYNLWTYGGTFSNNAPNMSLGARMEMSYVYIRDDRYTTVEAFKTAMSGVYLVYELATAFDQDYSQYFDTDWNKADLDNQYATCEMVVDEPIDMPNKVEYYGTIKDTLVDSIDIDNGGGDTSSVDLTDYTIEEDGWSVSNTLFNYRAFREGNRHKVVGRVDLGSLNYSMTISNNRYLFSTNDLDVSPQRDATVAIKAMSTIYNAVKQSVTWVDKNMSYNGAVGTTIVVFINNDYTSVEAFKQAMSGVYLYYELAEEVITPLNLPRNFYRIDTKQNGVTTFNNDNNQPCHNTLRYYYKEVKSNE